jgi:hypothetical protein
MSSFSNLTLSIASFFILVFVQVSLALSFRAAQDESGKYPFDPAAVLVVAEVLKFLLSLTLYSRSEIANKPEGWYVAFKSEIQSTPTLFYSCFALAVLYCANNNISFLLFQWMDGANINLFKSGSSFVSTLLLRFALHRGISSIQWAAVGLQVCGLAISQFGATGTNAPLLSASAYFVLLISLTITSICSVYNDKVLKDHANVASLHTVNALLYAVGATLNGLVYLFTSTTSEIIRPSFFSGFDRPFTWVVLFFNTVIGIVVSAVYKYADATIKTFASACATSALLLVNILIYNQDFKIVVVLACITVFIATYLYATNPVVTNQIPKSIATDSTISDVKVTTTSMMEERVNRDRRDLTITESTPRQLLPWSFAFFFFSCTIFLATRDVGILNNVVFTRSALFVMSPVNHSTLTRAESPVASPSPLANYTFFPTPSSTTPPSAIPSPVKSANEYKSHISKCENSTLEDCPRVAWVISGAIRTMPLPFVYKSIKSYGKFFDRSIPFFFPSNLFFVFLGIDAFGGRADVFLYLKRNETIDNRWRERGEPLQYDPFGDPMVVFDLLRPKTLKILPGGDTSPVNNLCEFMNRNDGQRAWRQNALGHFITAREGYQLVLDAEELGGYKYDWVIHARPDTSILRPLPAWVEWGNKSEKKAWFSWSEGMRGTGYTSNTFGPVYDGPSSCFEGVPLDHFNLFTRSSSDSFFLLYDQYLKCVGSGIPFGLNEMVCCGGGYSSAIHDTMTHANGQIWAPYQFPVALVRSRWVRRNFCNVGKADIPADNGYQPDVFNRCSLRPFPGCPCDLPGACPTNKTCSTDFLGSVVCS